MTDKKEVVSAEDNKSIKGLLEGPSFRQELSKSLPKHLSPDRFVRIALTAMSRTPKLKECDRVSFFQSLLTLSQLGIEPDGRRAHLIPFNNRKKNIVECQLLIDYKGLVELVVNTGEVSNIHADAVRENDHFVYDRGIVKQHEINFKDPRGNAYAYYAIIRFKDGSEKCEVMSKDDIESVRKRSKAKDDGPWKTDYDEMAKKTVFRRATKWVKLSPEQRDVIEKDDTQFDFNTIDIGVEYISEDQVKEIDFFIAENEVDIDKFQEFMKVDDISKVQAKDYGKAKSALDSIKESGK